MRLARRRTLTIGIELLVAVLGFIGVLQRTMLAVFGANWGPQG